jgi:transcriptional regulator with XRE-family HTH domain
MSPKAKQPSGTPFGAFLKRYLKESGCTQEKMAERIGEYLGNSNKISHTTVSAWCIGEYLPRNRVTVIAIVRVLQDVGGIQSTDQANELLGAWNHSRLTMEEINNIFPFNSESVTSEPLTADLEQIHLLQQAITEEVIRNSFHMDTHLREPKTQFGDNRHEAIIRQGPLNDLEQLQASGRMRYLQSIFTRTNSEFRYWGSYVAESRINPITLNRYYEQITETNNQVETFFAILSSSIAAPSRTEKEYQHELEYLKVQIDTIQNSIMASHVTGLYLRHSITKGQKSRLEQLQQLQPKPFINEQEWDYRIQELMVVRVTLLSRRKLLIAEAAVVRLLQQQAEDALSIRPSDEWNKVVAIAIELRNQGRIEESVHTFRQYEEMFGGMDPTVLQYLEIAQEVTQVASAQGIIAANYVFAVRKKSLCIRQG